MEMLSNRITGMSESETLAMTRKSRELKAQGFDVINLSVGEPDFFTPDNIKEAAHKAIDENFSFYPPVNGYLELREAICQKLQRDNKLHYTPDQIVVSTGAKQCIINALLCMVNPGEEVLIPTPYWVSYTHMVKITEGKPVFIEAKLENDFKITPEQLEKAITPKSKAFIFSSPCNPSGSVYSYDELKALAEVFEKHPHVYIISDEIYELINFNKNHESIAQFANIQDRVILINGVSKSFAMTGWRVGYMASTSVLAKAANKLQGQFTSATSSIAQKAAEEAMKTPPGATYQMLDKFKERRDLVLKLLQEVPGLKTNTPQGAFYIFFDASFYFGKTVNGEKIKNANDLCMYILNTQHVALVPGEAFGNPECIRISYATSNHLLEEAIRRIKEALSYLT